MVPLFRSWTLPTIEVEPAVISQADYILEILAQKQSKALTEYAPQLSQELNGNCLLSFIDASQS